MKCPNLCYGLLWKGHSCPFPQSSYRLPRRESRVQRVRRAPKGSELSVPAWRERIHVCWRRGFKNQTMEFHLFSHHVVLLASVWSQNCHRKQWINFLFFSACVQLLLYPLNYLFLKSFLTFLLCPFLLSHGGSKWLGWCHCRTGAALEASAFRKRAMGTGGRSML